VEDVHSVDLLEGATLMLTEEEVSDKSTGKVAGGEDVTVAVIDVVGDEAGEEGDQEVPSPVTGGSDTHGLCSVTSRVEFTDNTPNDGCPSCGVSGDEKTCEDDHDGTCSSCVDALLELEVTDRGKHHEHGEHPEATENEGLATTNILNDPKTTKGADEVDSTEDSSSDETVADTNRIEDGRTVVEEEVGTRQLLEHLETSSEGNTVGHTRTSKDLPEGVVSSSLLHVELGLDLADLAVDRRVVLRYTVDVGDSVSSLVDLSSAVVPARTFWKKPDTTSHDSGPNETDTHGDTP